MAAAEFDAGDGDRTDVTSEPTRKLVKLASTASVANVSDVVKGTEAVVQLATSVTVVRFIGMVASSEPVVAAVAAVWPKLLAVTLAFSSRVPRMKKILARPLCTGKGETAYSGHR